MLRKRWLELWERIHGDLHIAEREYENLVARYTEPNRFYHTLKHIEWCLDELDAVKDLAHDVNAVETALWYHDIVYDTHRSDNEAQSALLAMRVLAEARVPDDFMLNVRDLILTTQHTNIPDSWDIDAHLVVDIDLASLGYPFEVFLKNNHDIRKEYTWVSEDEFRIANSKILGSFLRRENIYGTEYFRKKYEDKAQGNIKHLLAMRAV